MWHRLWQNVSRPTDTDPTVAAGPPKFVIVAVAAGMICGALIAPAPATPGDAAPAFAATATVDHEVVD